MMNLPNGPGVLDNVIINSSIDGIIGLDRDFRYILWNKGIERITGMMAQEVLGKFAFDVFPFLRKRGVDGFYRRALEGKVTRVDNLLYEIPVTGKQGYYDAAYSPLIDDNGAVIGVISVIHDITARHQAERALAESELKYRSLTQYAHDGIISCDADGKILSWNQGASDIFGHREGEIVGKCINAIIPKDIWKNYIHEMKAGFTREALAKYGRFSDVLGTHKHGNSVPLDISLSAWNSEGRVFFSVLIRDLSPTKHLEAVAEDRKNIYEALLQAQSELGVGMALMDAESSRILNVNQALCEMYGYTHEEVMRIGTPRAFVAPEMSELVSKRIEARAKQGRRCDKFESVHVKKDGTRFFVELSVTSCETDCGPSAIALVRDITQRKRSELDLVEQKRLNNQIMDCAQDVIGTVSLDGEILTLSPSFETTTGWKREDWYGRDMSELIVPEDHPKVGEHVAAVLEGRKPPAIIARCLNKNGTISHIENQFSPIVRDGRIVEILGVARDVTARATHERDLLEEKLRFRTLSEATFEGIAISRNRVIIEANQSFCKMFGYAFDEVIGMKTDDFAPPEEAAVSRQHIETGSTQPYRSRGMRKDGSAFFGEVRGKTIQYKGSFVRVTAIREILP